MHCILSLSHSHVVNAALAVASSCGAFHDKQAVTTSVTGRAENLTEVQHGQCVALHIRVAQDPLSWIATTSTAAPNAYSEVD